MKKSIIVTLIGLLFWPLFCYSHQKFPDFTKIKDDTLREQAFFAFMLPKILKADRAVLLQREHLLALYRKEKSGKKLTTAELNWLKQLSREYIPAENQKQKEKILWHKLIERVDSIPISLALAQFDKDTSSGTTMHQYSDVGISIEKYFHLLNTNKAYRIFRELRAEERKNHTELSGITLASGLQNYSPLHELYIDSVRNIILQYQLEKLNPLIHQPSFTSYLKQLELQGKKEGISSKLLARNIPKIHLLPRTLSAAYYQPEGTLTYQRYLSLFVSLARINDGREKFDENKKLLKNIARYYRVQPQYLISLWGLETDYGNYPVDYPELSTLATLDYAGYRSAFFHKELLEVLKLMNDGNISTSTLYGSWAGAMGQCQFLPSRYLQFAVDYDHKGQKDIWHDRADVLGSTANFLHQLGWNNKLPAVREVILPKKFPKNLMGLTTIKTVKQWEKLGVRAKDLSLVNENAKTSLLLPTDKLSPAYLVYSNFNILKQWNNSNFYALSVEILANQIDSLK